MLERYIRAPDRQALESLSCPSFDMSLFFTVHQGHGQSPLFQMAASSALVYNVSGMN